VSRRSTPKIPDGNSNGEITAAVQKVSDQRVPNGGKPQLLIRAFVGAKIRNPAAISTHGLPISSVLKLDNASFKRA